MGNYLSQDASTFDLSQGLLGSGLEQQAAALEKLADQLGGLSEESRQQVKSMLQQSGEQLSANGLPQIGDELQNAAQAMGKAAMREDGTPSPQLVEAQEKLDNAAAGIREIANQLKQQQGGGDSPGGDLAAQDESDTVVSSQQLGEPKQIYRFTSEGEGLEFKSLDPTGSQMPGKLSQPGSGSTAQNGTAHGSSALSDAFYTSYIVPYYYPWKWHDVVSKFYSRY